MTPANDPILAVAVRAVRTAASIVADAARDLKRLPTVARARAEMASGAEFEAADAIVATIRAAFPQHAILGEESGHFEGAREGGGSRWLVDAIDGADNFLHGFPYYAVAVALAQGSEVTHAAILDPIHDELFTAVKGAGAYCNGSQVHVSACVDPGAALVATAVPAGEDPGLPVFASGPGSSAAGRPGIRRTGSASLDLAHLAAGRLDGFWSNDVRPGDLAAGTLLVREAGGRVGDVASGRLPSRTAGIVVAAPGIFNALREIVAAGR